MVYREVCTEGSETTKLGTEVHELDKKLQGWISKHYGFVPTYKKGQKGKYQLVVKASKWKELKAKLKHLTKKTTPASFDERIHRINLLIRGWTNYFKPASIYSNLKSLDEWLRNRLRYCIWHDWKKPERKVSVMNRRIPACWPQGRQARPVRTGV